MGVAQMIYFKLEIWEGVVFTVVQACTKTQAQRGFRRRGWGGYQGLKMESGVEEGIRGWGRHYGDSVSAFASISSGVVHNFSVIAAGGGSVKFSVIGFVLRILTGLFAVRHRQVQGNGRCDRGMSARTDAATEIFCLAVCLKLSGLYTWVYFLPVHVSVVVHGHVHWFGAVFLHTVHFVSKVTSHRFNSSISISFAHFLYNLV